jgi:hypothetical protein
VFGMRTAFRTMKQDPGWCGEALSGAFRSVDPHIDLPQTTLTPFIALQPTDEGTIATAIGIAWSDDLVTGYRGAMRLEGG